MNVLIIDDQPDVVEGIRLGIDWNFLAVSHIFHAYNSEAAKSVIEQEEVDIALCDIEMPNGSGLEQLIYLSHLPCRFRLCTTGLKAGRV